jgi:hypothetical protein
MQDERTEKSADPPRRVNPFAETAKGRPPRVIQSLHGELPAVKNLLEVRAQIRIIVWL